VVLAPDDAAAEVAIELWVHVGARHESPGRFGLAHFFEHAMPFGQGVIRTRLGRALFDSMRTNSNALTRFDYTRYYTQLRPEALDLFLLAAADRLRADPVLELTTGHVNAHRRNVQAEIARAANGTWGWPVKSALHAATFGPHHPYGHHMYGSDAETRDATADDMLRWFRAHMRPEYTTLVVVGEFDTTAARAAIERAFGGIPGGARPARAAPWVPPAAPITDTVSIAADRSYVFFSWPVPPASSDAEASLSLLARVLTRRLAASRPAAVEDASAEAEFWELAGRFGLTAEFRPDAEENRPAVEAWLRRALTDLVTRGPTEAELRAARDGELADIREQMVALGWQGSRAELLGEGVIFSDDPDAFRVLLERQQSVSPAVARRTAEQWLSGRGAVLVVRSPASRDARR
jgi:predicted Zn-dependent peptidase